MTIDNRTGDHHDQKYRAPNAPCVRAPYGLARCGSCVCGSCVPEVEVPCPRATLAAMIAAAAFGPRRSGKPRTAPSGAAYRAISVRQGPSWPLPAIVLAVKLCALTFEEDYRRARVLTSRVCALADAYCVHHEIPRRSQGLHPLR